MVQPLWTVWWFLTKLTTLLPCNLAIMILSIYLKVLKTYIHTQTWTKTLIIAKLGATKRSFSRWIERETVLNPCNGLWFTTKKKWAIKPWQDREEPWIHVTKLQKPIRKGHILYDSNQMTRWKRQNHGDSIKDQWLLGAGRGERNDEVGHRGLLGQWKYTAWYCTDGNMSLYVCPNQQDAQLQEWTMM